MINLNLIFASRLVWRKFDFLPVDILVVFLNRDLRQSGAGLAS